MPDARLLILGEGKYRPTLERLIAHLGLTDWVDLPGHLSQPEVFDRISQASLFVLASESKADNLPNTVKEAMALGVPVISTPTTGIEELIEDGVSGCIVPMGDVDSITRNSVRILSDQSFTKNLILNGIQHVEEHFDIRKTTETRKRLYGDLITHGELATNDFVQLCESFQS